ncbi:MAG: 1-deoxy-D-xylulose-5-phosphate synthase [Bacteroidaceae bacterium]|nr:1-deoxy-D-xylulose-5-phosphate synthase [Bacteroidaceae bacterium]
MALLEHIHYPADLRQLKVEDLPLLCKELREDIVKELSVNPGHLASSLGVVEITVAMHYVFNTPEDRIVWDVGHQAYGHKILTGRREKFNTNRKLGGIRPFPSPKESEYDTFTCGHASNSISAALGMAVANEFQQSIYASVETAGSDTENVMKKAAKRNVVALIGDGAMSGGLAFEGLNNVSSTPNNLLIILNDNDMSIDDSVGGMKEYLKNLNTNETYNKIKFKVSNWLKSSGHLDVQRKNKILRFSNAVKSAISGQQNIFEGLNIRYFGHFDGHNVIELVRVLTQLKNMEGPRLLHIHTKKGHGYEPAEENPSVWHAPGKFDAETGERIEKKQELTKYQDVFGHTLLEMARENPRIVGVTPAMPSGCSMCIMQAEMPDRVFDVGIAEGHAVTFSAGLAKEGMLPFCNIYSSFSQRAYDNIIHDAAILNLPVVMCLDRAGLVGEDGSTHHGAYDLAFLRAIPNLTICAPMNEIELRNMMYSADGGTFVIRYPRGCGAVADWRKPFEKLPIGQGRKLKDGEGVAVLSIGNIGNNVAKAILETEQENETIKVAHYDMRFVKPLDINIIREAAKKYKSIITVEDGCKKGGFGSAVLETLCDICNEENIQMPRVVMLGIPDKFVEHGTVPQLQQICGIDVEGIKQCLNAEIYRERLI